MDTNGICTKCMLGHIAENGCCDVCGSPVPVHPKNSPALPPLTILHGRYLLGSTLGQGGFGITYVGYDLNYSKRIAVKEFFPAHIVTRSQLDHSVTVNKDFSYYERCKQSFLNEAQMIYGFADHKNIVNIYHIFNDNNTVYYVMEYLEGETLEKKLRQLGTRMSWEQLCPIVGDILNALDTIHKQGYIHRDVSPDNIFILKDGRTKLIDFGASRYIKHQSELTVVLKKGFAPPEQYKTEGRQGAWTDIYALAATIYYCLVGKMIPEAPDRVMGSVLQRPSECSVNLPPNVEAAILKALDLNIERRFISVQQFANSLFGGFVPQVQENGWQIRITKGCYKGNVMRGTGNITVGRDPKKCTLVYPDKTPGISRLHMTFLFGVGDAFPGIRCDTATGMIYINQMPFSGQNRICKLSNGDVISFGDYQEIRIEKL